MTNPGPGFLTALRVESFATLRSTTPWLLAALPAAAVALRLALARLTAGEDAAAFTLNAAGEEVANGYGFLVDGFATGLTLLYLVFIAYAAYSFAVDRDSGVVRHLIIRRISRRALLAAKLIIVHAFALLSLLAVLAVSWLFSVWFWELGPVVEDGFEIIDEAMIREEIRAGLLLAILPLPAALALGLLISASARSATQAVGLAVGFALVLDVFKSTLGDGAHYLYASFQPSLIDESYLGEVARIVRGYSDVLIDPTVQQLNIWIPVPQAMVLFIIAMLVIGRRRL
ncbi:ABC transporter permease subunit [Proteobacteria bacterium 005FR1]|nr:ABC transporter permease subunit [Proteobacteria bacterium 005FR1]